MQIGFVGLGLMGMPMAENLVRGGHAVRVYNRTPEKARELGQRGAAVCGSIREVAEQCDLILICVSNDDAVRQVVAGPQGILAHVRPGTLIADHSTVSPDTTRALAEQAAARGAGYLDAPVSGGVAGARNATLAIMVGGDPTHLDRAAPAFKSMGKHIFHCGPTGNGNIVKLINNMIGAINLLGAIEGLVMGVKAGVDPDLITRVVNVSSGRSAATESSVPNRILKGDFAPGFSIDLMTKDLNLAFDFARSQGVRVLQASTALQAFVEAQAKGLGAKDTSGMVLALEELAQVRVRAE